MSLRALPDDATLREVAVADTIDVHALAVNLSHSRAESAVRGCSNPIRLTGSSTTLDTATGEVVRTYASADEPDGYTYVRCGNRRASVCPSCSREYKGDAWHILMAGLSGGLGVPESVTDHPSIFLTLTAPSFGPVHRATSKRGSGKKSPCRARRDRPVCPHGRPLSCNRRHDPETDRFVGQPLCRDCYDYTAHAIWQWHAPELWRRFTEYFRRNLARAAGLPVNSTKGVGFTDLARISYTKVAEFQARGAVHFHAVIRLDGPHGPTTTPRLDFTADDLTTAAHAAVGQVYYDAPTPAGDTLRLRWGQQVDTRTITHGAGRDNTTGPAHPGMVGGYLAKYLTKGVEEFGLPATSTRIRSAADARHVGATDHAVRLIAAASGLVGVHEDYRPIAKRLGMLGYRGHPITKSRAYSATFGSRREARRTWRRQRARLAPTADVRDVLDIDTTDDAETDTTITIGTWRYAGRGYLDNFDAAKAVMSATHARIRTTNP